jgi:ATP-dependent 26S proteasome regulatory subunit
MYIQVKTPRRTPKIASTLTIHFTYLSKHEFLVERIEALVREKLKNESIFLHKAIDTRFTFLDLSDGVTNKLVHSENEERQLNANIFRFIKSADSIAKLGVRIKRTVLLTGGFGSGKSLTALKAAQRCVEHGWTFLNVVPGDDIVEALAFASRYQPCVVFFEDIDQVTSDERGEKINEILNTIDGILSKTAKVLTILTTNNPEAIERAMIRSGRIDAVIKMGYVDKPTLGKLIVAYLGEQLIEEPDLDLLMKASVGYPPAFISGACEQASLYALDRSDGNPEGVRITNNDLEAALHGLREQYDLMMTDRTAKVVSIDSRVGEIVGKEIGQFKSAVVADMCAACDPH